jgi:hypothetical protein
VALDCLKALLSSPLVLVTPDPCELLLLYLDTAGLRSCSVMGHVDEEQAQAFTAMGRTLQHRRGDTTRHG